MNDNIGGLYRIYVCPVRNLTAEGGIVSADKLLSVPFIVDTGERKCFRKEDKNGVYYDLSVTCTVVRSDGGEQLAETFPDNYILITMDYNGVTRMDGNADEPIRCETESETGEKFEDLSCVKLKFSRKLRRLTTCI